MGRAKGNTYWVVCMPLYCMLLTLAGVLRLILTFSLINYLQEVNRPFDEEYDDDFEGEAGRQKKRRPGLVMFDGYGEEGVL